MKMKKHKGGEFREDQGCQQKQDTDKRYRDNISISLK